ncbi:MAG: methyltransferase domain-containing protein [Hyphomicrobiales bacterium]
MQSGDYSLMLDSGTKFFRSLYMWGWFHHPTDKLKTVILHDPEITSCHTQVGLPHGGVKSLGENLGFVVQTLRSDDKITRDFSVEFVTEGGQRIFHSFYDLCRDRIERYSTPTLTKRFVEEVDRNNWSVLDVGGRSRSRIDRSNDFKTSDYVVLDILPGENVDIVGDAHTLASYFPAERFDAFLSVSVFEHLMMPWTVVTQLNRVLKMSGVGLVSTHQSLGLHDMPWDFWRFSDTAWDALFNKYTGLEILERSLDFDQYLLPFIFRPSKQDAERSVGFEASAVLVKKIGPSLVEWNLRPSDISTTNYPNNDDGYKPDGFGDFH